MPDSQWYPGNLNLTVECGDSVVFLTQIVFISIASEMFKFESRQFKQTRTWRYNSYLIRVRLSWGLL